MTFSQFFEAPVTNSCSCQYYLTPIDHSRFSRQSFFDTPVFKSFSRIILQNNMPYFYFLLQPSSALILWNIANGNFETAMFHPLTQNSSKVPLWYLSAMKDMTSEAVTLWLVWNLVGDLADPHIALVSVSFSSLIKKKKIKSISTVNNDRLAVLIGLNILSHNLLFSWDQSQKYLYIKKRNFLGWLWVVLALYVRGFGMLEGVSAYDTFRKKRNKPCWYTVGCTGSVYELE